MTSRDSNVEYVHDVIFYLFYLQWTTLIHGSGIIENKSDPIHLVWKKMGTKHAIN